MATEEGRVSLEAVIPKPGTAERPKPGYLLRRALDIAKFPDDPASIDRALHLAFSQCRNERIQRMNERFKLYSNVERQVVREGKAKYRDALVDIVMDFSDKYRTQISERSRGSIGSACSSTHDSVGHAKKSFAGPVRSVKNGGLGFAHRIINKFFEETDDNDSAELDDLGTAVTSALYGVYAPPSIASPSGKAHSAVGNARDALVSPVIDHVPGVYTPLGLKSRVFQYSVSKAEQDLFFVPTIDPIHTDDVDVPTCRSLKVRERSVSSSSSSSSSVDDSTFVAVTSVSLPTGASRVSVCPSRKHNSLGVSLAVAPRGSRGVIVIARVKRGSPAMEAGIQPGWQLIAVDAQNLPVMADNADRVQTAAAVKSATRALARAYKHARSLLPTSKHDPPAHTAVPHVHLVVHPHADPTLSDDVAGGPAMVGVGRHARVVAEQTSRPPRDPSPAPGVGLQELLDPEPTATLAFQPGVHESDLASKSRGQTVVASSAPPQGLTSSTATSSVPSQGPPPKDPASVWLHGGTLGKDGDAALLRDADGTLHNGTFFVCPLPHTHPKAPGFILNVVHRGKPTRHLVTHNGSNVLEVNGSVYGNFTTMADFVHAAMRPDLPPGWPVRFTTAVRATPDVPRPLEVDAVMLAIETGTTSADTVADSLEVHVAHGSGVAETADDDDDAYSEYFDGTCEHCGQVREDLSEHLRTGEVACETCWADYNDAERTHDDNDNTGPASHPPTTTGHAHNHAGDRACDPPGADDTATSREASSEVDDEYSDDEYSDDAADDDDVAARHDGPHDDTQVDDVISVAIDDVTTIAMDDVIPVAMDGDSASEDLAGSRESLSTTPPLWLHGCYASKEAANAVLRGYGGGAIGVGDFFVRALDTPGQHALVLGYQKSADQPSKATHHRIQQRSTDGVYLVNNKVFGGENGTGVHSLTELINALQQPQAGWPVVLSRAVPVPEDGTGVHSTAVSSAFLHA